MPCNGAVLPESCCLLTLQAFSALNLSTQTKFAGTKLSGLLFLDGDIRKLNHSAAASRSENL